MAKIDFINDLVVTKDNLESALEATKSYVDEKDTATNNIIGNYPSLVDQEVQGQLVPATPPIATRLAALEGRITLVEQDSGSGEALANLQANVDLMGGDIADIQNVIGNYPAVNAVTTPGSWAEFADASAAALSEGSVEDYSVLPSNATDGAVYETSNPYTDDASGVTYPAGYYKYTAPVTTPGVGTVSDRLDGLEDEIDAMSERIANLDLFTKRIVTELPQISAAEPNILYIVPDTSTDATQDNSFVEYILVEETTKLRDDFTGDPSLATEEDYVKVPAHFEEVGRATSKVDLSGYYNKAEVDQAILDSIFDDTTIQADLTTIKTQIGTYPTTVSVEKDGSWEHLDTFDGTVIDTVANYGELPKRGVDEGSVYSVTDGYTDPETNEAHAAGYYRFTPVFETVATKNIATRLSELEGIVGEINVMSQADVETMCDDIFGPVAAP